MAISNTTAAHLNETRDKSVEALPLELTIVVVTWNTRDLTLRCLETLFDNTHDLRMRVIVADNGSEDGSAEAIAERFPQVDLIRNESDFGFARANNEAIKHVDSEWVLLLNPDTEVYPNAIANLLAFSKQHPEAGITGGRTFFRDGSLNKTSCFNKISAWSLFCFLTGMTQLFKDSELLNPEAIGGWQRDTVRHVDVVTGCFFMLKTELWRKLNGFNHRYFMYGEEADLCLRAAKLGYRPMITPDAQIMHIGGASAPKGVRMLQNWRAKVTLVKDHFPKPLVPVGLAEIWLAVATRALVATALNKTVGRSGQRNEEWIMMWTKRREWLKGY